jgi:hypothetical protein
MTLLADAGSWHGEQLQNIVNRGIQVLVPPDDQPTQDHAAQLGRRPRRLHAPGPNQQTRRRALPDAPADDRARLRPDQVHPRPGPLQTPRTSRRQNGIAPHHGHAQPPQAPPARHSGRLSARSRRPPPRRRNLIPSKPSFAGTASDFRDSQAWHRERGSDPWHSLLPVHRGSACADEQAFQPLCSSRNVTAHSEGRTPWPKSRQQSSADATIGNSANARRRPAPVIPRPRKRNKRAGATRRPRTET